MLKYFSSDDGSSVATGSPVAGEVPPGTPPSHSYQSVLASLSALGVTGGAGSSGEGDNTVYLAGPSGSGEGGGSFVPALASLASPGGMRKSAPPAALTSPAARVADASAAARNAAKARAAAAEMVAAAAAAAEAEAAAAAAAADEDELEFNPFVFIKMLPPYSRVCPVMPRVALPAKRDPVVLSNGRLYPSCDINLVLDLDETLVHCR